jgi:hypothetical protein
MKKPSWPKSDVQWVAALGMISVGAICFVLGLCLAFFSVEEWMPFFQSYRE